MYMKKKEKHGRNWALVVVASIVITLNTGLLIAVSLSTATLGWWALVIVIGAISSIWLSVTAIKKNDPTWLLLDMILPN